MTASDQTPRAGRFARARWVIGGAFALALLIAALHGRSLTYGLFMDDYAHYDQLRSCDWSLGGLAWACHLDLIGGVVELWWLPDVTLRFFRPVAFGIMKLTYTLTGWSPLAMHVASLAWHLTACVLLMLLLRQIGGVRRGFAWAAAALFAIHPAHVATVQWIAAQSELIVTTLLLAALLSWGRFRGWHADPAMLSASASRRPWLWAVLSIVLYALAVGARENAILFPIVVGVVELVLSRRGRRDVWVAYGALAIVAVVYLAVRSYYLGGAALPPRPYVVPPTEPDFVRYVFDKACYYLLGEFLLVPCVPIGGLPYLRERPLVFYGLALLVAAVLIVVVWRNRRRPIALLGAAALLCFMAPVLPAFESPHHLYLPGVGWAVLAALTLEGLAGKVDARGAAARLRQATAGVVVCVSGLIFGTATFFFGLALDTAQAVEDQVVEEIATAPVPVQDGDTLYVVNLPMIAHYTKLAVEMRTGTRDLRVMPITWSPRLLGMATPAEWEWVDGQSAIVRIAEDRYFSGPMQLLIEETTGQPLIGPDGAVNQLVLAGEFTIEPLAADDAGVQAFRIAFKRDLSHSGVHVFWGSRSRWAFQLVPQKDGL